MLILLLFRAIDMDMIWLMRTKGIQAHEALHAVQLTDQLKKIHAEHHREWAEYRSISGY